MADKYKPNIEEWLDADSRMSEEQRKLTLEREHNLYYGEPNEEKERIDTPEIIISDLERMFANSEAVIHVLSFHSASGQTLYEDFSRPAKFRAPLQLQDRDGHATQPITEVVLGSDRDFNEVVAVHPAYRSSAKEIPRPKQPIVEKGIFGSKTRYVDAGYDVERSHNYLKMSDVVSNGSDEDAYILTLGRWSSFNDHVGRRGVFEMQLVLPRSTIERLVGQDIKTLNGILRQHPELLNDLLAKQYPQLVEAFKRGEKFSPNRRVAFLLFDKQQIEELLELSSVRYFIQDKAVQSEILDYRM